MGPILACALGGTLVRLAYTLILAAEIDPGFTDAAFYSAAGNLLADGEGYVDVFRSLEAGTLVHTAHHPPGWPALLAVASLGGVDTVLGHRLVGAVLGGVVVVVVGLLARRVAGPVAGTVAAAGAALHPTLVAADASLMTETLGGVLVLATLLAALQTVSAPTVLCALVTGAAIGGAALTRGEAAMFAPVLALVIAAAAARRGCTWGLSLRTGGLVVLAAVAVVAPWAARNAAVLGEVVPVSTNDATVLAGANCDAVYAGPGLGSWDLSCAQTATADVRSGEAAEASAARQVALEHVREHPGRLAVVVPVRVLRTWGLWSPYDPPAEGRHVATQEAGTVAWLVVLLPAAVVGAVVLRRRRLHVELAVLLAPVVVATAASAVGAGMLRLRHPIELSALVLAGVAADALARRWRPVASGTPTVVGS